MIALLIAIVVVFALFLSLSWLGAELNARRSDLRNRRRRRAMGLAMGYVDQLRRRNAFGFVRPRVGTR